MTITDTVLSLNAFLILTPMQCECGHQQVAYMCGCSGTLPRSTRRELGACHTCTRVRRASQMLLLLLWLHAVLHCVRGDEAAFRGTPRAGVLRIFASLAGLVSWYIIRYNCVGNVVCILNLIIYRINPYGCLIKSLIIGNKKKEILDKIIRVCWLCVYWCVCF